MNESQSDLDLSTPLKLALEAESDKDQGLLLEAAEKWEKAGDMTGTKHPLIAAWLYVSAANTHPLSTASKYLYIKAANIFEIYARQCLGKAAYQDAALYFERAVTYLSKALSKSF